MFFFLEKKLNKKTVIYCILQVIFTVSLSLLFNCIFLPDITTGFFFSGSTAVTSGELSKYVPV